ncbi:MAG: GNAT family N-acetyltransferase [Ferruginibacter sp.]
MGTSSLLNLPVNTHQLTIIYREARKNDIPQIQIVRNSVKENMLSNPALVSDADCNEFLFTRGKGWVAIAEEIIVGFSIVDMKEHNVWALFVHPDFAFKGIGKKLHNLMLQWYFQQTKQSIWLGTAPGTRAAKFYHLMGWKEFGTNGDKEIKFEMEYKSYVHLAKKNI